MNAKSAMTVPLAIARRNTSLFRGDLGGFFRALVVGIFLLITSETEKLISQSVLEYRLSATQRDRVSQECPFSG